MASQSLRENPFRDCADPGSAIPSVACDRALFALEHAILGQCNPIVLLGPSGSGKTLLLRRIAQHPPPSIRTIFLPWLNVAPEEVIPWIHGIAGAEGTPDNFLGSARAFHERGFRTLLLVDEAQSIPRDTAQHLAELVKGGAPSLQILLAGVDGDSLRAAVAEFSNDATYVEIASPLTPQEVSNWVRDHLNPEQLSLLKDLDCGELVQQAKGVPRLVRWELERRLATGDLAAALRRESLVLREETAKSVPPAKSEEILEQGRVLPQDPARTRSASLVHEDVTSQRGTTLLEHLSEVTRRFAHRSQVLRFSKSLALRRHALLFGEALGRGLQSLAATLARLGEACRRFAGLSSETLRRGGRALQHGTRLLAEALRRRARSVREIDTTRIQLVGGLVVESAEGVAARFTAGLRNARIWSAHYSTRLVAAGRRSRLAAAELKGRVEATLGRVFSRIRHAVEKTSLPSVPRRTDVMDSLPGTGGQDKVVESGRRRELLLPSLRRGFQAPRGFRLSELRAGPIAALAALAMLFFLLGRMTAGPLAESKARDAAPGVPNVSSGPQASAPEASARAEATNMDRPETSPLPQAPEPPSESTRRNTLTAPKRIVVKIEVQPKARVWIDGRYAGRAPFKRLSLTPGHHHFEVFFSDGHKIRRTVEIRHETHVVKFS